METVYITHGAKYHVDANCRLMNSGEDLHDYEGDVDYGGGFTSGSYRKTGTVQDATMRGKLPCLHCVPAELRAFPPLYGQTFGHVPKVAVDALDGPQPNKPRVCARCIRHVRKWSSRTVGYDERAGVQWENGWVYLQLKIAWPCTSAIVLGLVPREVTP